MKEWDDILRLAAASDGPMAFASVVRTSGSTYRKPGARMLVTTGGPTAGIVSGGCLEEHIVAEARAVIRDGKPRLLFFDTRRWFGCHGAVEVFIERIAASQSFLDEIRAARQQREVSELATIFENDDAAATCSFVLPLSKLPEDRSGVLFQRIEPRFRLLIVGDGPEGPALEQLASVLGWEIHAAAHPGALESLPDSDPWTAVVVINHHYGRDFAALQKFLPQPHAYLGLLGPRRRREQLLIALIDEGFVPPDVALDKFHGPAGLDLGARAPEEIALAIIAEIQAVFRTRSGGSLDAVKLPIRACAAAR